MFSLIVQTAQANNPNQISIIFDKQPKLKGMDFHRKNINPSQANGKEAWAAQWGSQMGGVGWGRSFLFTITDPKFKNGNFTSVDLEIEYRQTANVPVRILCDTQNGSQQVGMAWGGGSSWKTTKVSFDNAFFGNRTFKNDPKKMQTDGFDIRINSYNEDLMLRRITVTGYHLDKDINYSRLISLSEIKTKKGIFLFAPNEKEVLEWHFDNLAKIPVKGNYSFALEDWQGNSLSKSSGSQTIDAEAISVVPVTLDTTNFSYGPYAATFKLVEDSGKMIFERKITFGVSSSTKLSKAKDGEFLYGLDASVKPIYKRPYLLKWTEAMGVDILRHGFSWNPRVEEIDEKLPIYKDIGLQVMYNLPPRHVDDPIKMQEQLDRYEAFAEAAAAKYKDDLIYWELGNEPDLKTFYNGPIENYLEGYLQLYRAIKRGNPDTIVMNGGLSFFLEEGERRSRRFIELVPDDAIDLYAYHGHGAGSVSEREALERIKAVVKEFNKEEKGFVETESGVSATSKRQQIVQAATVIQKTVFAQSQGHDLFFWFRLLMDGRDKAYTCLNSEQEPRPAILSYRTMVEILRRHHFYRELSVNKPETEAYLFRTADGQRKVCALWSNQPASYTIYLQLAEDSAEISQVQ
ncbi:MAG: hypothetical protein AAF558_11600, partial [Verrucomicrobiota bacterium]